MWSLYMQNVKRIYNYIVPQRFEIKRLFKKRLGYSVNIKSPKTFNEKIQWLKLNYRQRLMTIAADKYEVRKYVEKVIGQEYLIPIWTVFEDYAEINDESLPESFALKATHGSGWNIICHDKSVIDINELKKKVKRWQKTNYYYFGKEWAYKDIKPRIVCERLILDENKKSPADFKFFCFGGNPKYVQIDIDRFENHRRIFYNTKWEKQEFGLEYPTTDKQVEQPDNLEKMLEVAGKLSEGFPFVRVDLYNLNGKIYFGELTFYPGNGFEKFSPKTIDLEFGELINLPKGN